MRKKLLKKHEKNRSTYTINRVSQTEPGNFVSFTQLGYSAGSHQVLMRFHRRAAVDLNVPMLTNLIPLSMGKISKQCEIIRAPACLSWLT